WWTRARARGSRSARRSSRASRMARMADRDELALSLPETTKKLTSDGRPEYYVHDKLFCCHRGLRKDAVDPKTGERLGDVVMFRVPDLDMKELLLADARDIFFTTPHFHGYPALLVRIPHLTHTALPHLPPH